MNRCLLLILGLSIILNLAITGICFNHQSRFIDPDSRDYIKLADNLAAFNGYTKGEEAEIFRAPGYPIFIAPFRYLFSQTVLPVIIFQCLLATGTVYLLWLLTLSITGGDTKIAKFAAIIQAISLSSIVYANKVLSETLFTFLLILSFLMLENLVSAMNSKNQSEEKEETAGTKYRVYITSLITGTICGALVAIRAIFIPIFPLFLIYLWVKGAPNLRGRRTIRVYKLIAIMLLPYLAVIGLWTLRNSQSANYNSFSSVGSINIYRYYACSILAKDNNITFAEQQAICDANLDAAGSQVQKAKYAILNGAPVLKSSPVRYLFMHLKANCNTLLPAIGDFYAILGKNIGGKGTLSVINSKGLVAGIKHYFDGNWGLFILALPLIGILLVKYILTTTGSVIQLTSTRINPTMVMYILFILYMITVPGTVSHPRFRVPIEPLLSLFAAIGLCKFLACMPYKFFTQRLHF